MLDITILTTQKKRKEKERVEETGRKEKMRWEENGREEKRR